MTTASIPELARHNLQKILPWDLSEVRGYLREKDGFTPETLAAMELEYKRFLALTLAAGPNVAVPISDAIDPFWHTHLIFTRNYTRMCHELADGIYIHHLPAVSAAEMERLCGAYTERTLPLYREAFGEPSVEFWPPNAQICIACCDRDSPTATGEEIRQLII